jgi:hypothetical protein
MMPQAARTLAAVVWEGEGGEKMFHVKHPAYEKPECFT